MSGVSVVVPTYNRRDTLPRALDSILNQTHPPSEIVVVDDASTDGTEELINTEYPFVEYIQHETNRGGSAARNTGIRAANNELIAFLDSDDQWLPEKLERQVDLMESLGQDYGVVYTGIKVVRNGQMELGRVPSASGWIYEEQLARDHVGPTSTVLARKECFDEVGEFRTDLKARQDYEMWLRIAREFKFEHVQAPLTVLYTDSSNRISEEVDARIRSHEKIIAEITEELSSLPEKKRDEILATQYYTLARYCQKNGRDASASIYYEKSLKLYPFRFKPWVGMVMLLTPLSTREGLLLRLKNKLRAYD